MMRIETVFAAAALTFAILVVPTAGSAQSLSTPSSDSSFLVAADTEQGQQQRTTDPSGIGFGVKAGVLFSSFRDARDDYKSSDGWHYDLLFVAMNLVIATTGGGRFVLLS